MPKSKASVDEADWAEMLLLKDEVKTNTQATTEICGELNHLKQDVVLMADKQDTFAKILTSMNTSVNDLNSQVAFLTELFKFLHPSRASSSAIPVTQTSVALTQQPRPEQQQQQANSQDQPVLDGSKQHQQAAQREQQLEKQCAFEDIQLPPPINVGQHSRSAPPGFERTRPQKRELARPPVTPRTPHTPAFQNFQPPAVRRG
jgi:uncharacterized protein YoxC